MPTVSAIIPVFNAENSLPDLYHALVAVLERSSDAFEIILVEDGGRDGSWAIIGELAAQDSRVHGIRLSRNYGQHNALLCGIRAARHEVIVTLDDDLQNPPAEIPRLIEKLDEGFDVVYGTPAREQHGLLRNLASIMTKIALQNGMGVETARNVSAFRAFRTRLRDGFKSYRGPFVSIDVLLTWATSRFTAIKVRHEPRDRGQSNYTLGKLINHAVNLLTGFSTVPLQIASMMGFVFTLFGFGVLIWVVGRYFIAGGSIPGFPFLASIIAIFSGVQLFALGIFGEYLARIHFRTMDRPPYVTSESTNHD
jgi:undecaprenyl-phosphate 4-deoxy-4-formamido-L-arabinose transferase